ncbi:peroxiredoxin [Pontiellaceae bacterium B1224]|nr:peroxiredoxin [Pontiellaceae bacterium B1224]
MKIWLIGMAALCAALTVTALEVGDSAPLFTAKDQDGADWVLKDQLGDKPVVVYFYPAAMTGGCTKQACSYRDYVKNGETAFVVVGISADGIQNLKWFQTSENLNFPLLSDPAGRIAGQFGVPVKAGEKVITRTVDGSEVELKRSATTARWTFIISPEGKVVYKSDKVKATEDLGAVMTFLTEAE